MFKGGRQKQQQSAYRCSFCGKHQEQVQRLIAGPGGVYICDECVALCQEIIEEEQVRQAEGAVGIKAAPTLRCDTCGTCCEYTHHYCFNCGQRLNIEI